MSPESISYPVTILSAETELWCNKNIKGCSNLRRVTFGPSSSLERIGSGWLYGTQVADVSIPDGVLSDVMGASNGAGIFAV